MSDPTLPPTTPTADARNRALRTVIQGLAVDVGLAVILALGSALVDADFAWTGDYWRVLGLSLAKTAVMAAVAYVMRLKMPPPAPEDPPAGGSRVVPGPTPPDYYG